MEKSMLGIALIAMLFQIGTCLNIQNPDDPTNRTFIRRVELDSTVTMKCVEHVDSSEGENFGANAVKWHKTQDVKDIDDPTSGFEVASIATLHPGSVFKESGRFSVEFHLAADTVDVHMTISDIQEEDSGWYTCFATNNADKIYKIRYELQVYVAPSRVVLSGKPTDDMNDTLTSGPLLFNTTKPGVLKCTAVNAYPAPTLRMTIEGEDKPLTGYGQPHIDLSLEGPVIGMQKIRYNTTITVNEVMIRADQNGKKVHCTASDASRESENHAPVGASRVLRVLYPPKLLNCHEDWKANVNDVNVKFGCTFEANPVPEVLWKSFDRPPTYIRPDGKIVGRLYSAQVRATTMKTTGNISIFQTDLNLVRITENSYHRYALELSNEIGKISREFVLNPGEVVREAVVVNNSAGVVTSSTIFICVITLTAIIFWQ